MIRWTIALLIITLVSSISSADYRVYTGQGTYTIVSDVELRGRGGAHFEELDTNNTFLAKQFLIPFERQNRGDAGAVLDLAWMAMSHTSHRGHHDTTTPRHHGINKGNLTANESTYHHG